MKKQQAQENGWEFRVGIGAEAVREMLCDIDLDALAEELRTELQGALRARDPPRQRGPEAPAHHQAPGGRGGLPHERQQARVDDPRRGAGHPAGAAPHGAAGRRPLRHRGPERPLPPRHQPQQPLKADAGDGRAGHHRPQRKAHAAGGRGRPHRQRPPRPPRHRRGRTATEEPVRPAARQAGPLPPEPAWASAWTTPAVRSSSSARR